MEDKMFFKKLFVIIASCCILPFALFAGETVADSNASYYVTQNEKGEEVLVQRFTWESSPYALKYDFTIQMMNKKGEYTTIKSQETTESFVELSLTAGKYRYKVAVTNLLGVLEGETEWSYVEIIKAFQPKFTSVSPENIYLEEVQDGIFNITGLDLQDQCEYYLADNLGNRRLPLEVIERDGRKLKLKLNPDLLSSLNYTLVAKNPGGLTDKVYPIAVKFKKPVDFDVSIGYLCPVVLFDDSFSHYLDLTAFPLSATFKMSLLPGKNNYGYFGFGLEGSYSRIIKTTENFSFSGNLYTAYLNFVYQYALRKQYKDSSAMKNIVTFEVHAGAGAVLFHDLVFSYNSRDGEGFNSLDVAVDIGASIQAYITKRMFLEANVDFTYAFMSDMQMGLLMPSVLIGWQL